MWLRMTAIASPESMWAYAAVPFEPTIPKVEPAAAGRFRGGPGCSREPIRPGTHHLVGARERRCRHRLQAFGRDEVHAVDVTEQRRVEAGDGPGRHCPLRGNVGRQHVPSAGEGSGRTRLHMCRSGPTRVTGALAQIARETVEFVTGADLARLRTCAGCTLLFVDRSRPGTRRWCSMERCGNRNKTAHYRQKHRS